MQLKSFDDITIHHRHIFLSPHFDDVVFSCGGTLAVQISCGLRPLVITVFAGAPQAGIQLSSFGTQVQRSMSLGPDPASVVAARRQEDAKALDYLGVDYLWLDHPDAIYRGTPPYYTQEDQLFGDLQTGDLEIDKQLAQDLVALSERLPDAVWYAPLGVGRHVDHQIVCSAADRLIQRGTNVKLYEDFPYAARQNALQERLKEFGSALEPALVEMSEMLPARQEASEMYSSQISSIFGDKDAMYKLMDSYTHGIRPVETVRLERYWTAR